MTFRSSSTASESVSCLSPNDSGRTKDVISLTEGIVSRIHSGRSDSNMLSLSRDLIFHASSVRVRMDNLGEVLNGLKSSGAKARQEALTKIREVFARDKVVANFHIDARGRSKPEAWLVVFQALFSAVLSEKEAISKKKATATAQKRLTDAASTVRWLTERTVHHMNDKVTKALSDHLIYTMVHRGELLTPVALDYIKALRCIISFAPHLEQMDDAIWITIVERAFNIVLGDPVRSSFEDDTVNSSPAPEADDSDLFDDDRMNVDSDGDPLHSSSRKRPRSDSGTAVRPSTHRSASHQKDRKIVSVSHEQVEFMAVLSLLLRSPGAPIISSGYPSLARTILLRLQRFLDIYPPDTSLIHDYIAILSFVLPSLSLNRVFDVQNFTRSSWDDLLGLWGTKNKKIREGLVVILRILFPFTTFESDAQKGNSTFDCTGSIARLSSLLKGEAESRWGGGGLSLDVLRLEVATSHAGGKPEGVAFVAKTFRSCWNFEEGQALAWVILELQADCVGKLFQLSEAVHPHSTPGTVLKDGKRPRLENPIASLLTSIQHRPEPGIRSYYFQILLFVIDRHWLILHEALRQQVIQTLLRFISHEDSTILSWVFLCLAAVADAEGSSMQASSSEVGNRQETGTMWDSIWTNAIRRANVPIVCRAACHTAYTIMFHAFGQKQGVSRVPLASQRILLEIEALAKDLDVQGPPFPYDSVCTFLAHCLKIASQDMRLYRMQLEEKVLTWLVDCWKVVEVHKTSLPMHMANDVIMLLESICGFSKRCDLVFLTLLPECQISTMLLEEAKNNVIRDFLLYARLPRLALPKDERMVPNSFPRDQAIDESQAEMRLVQPRGRERRISGFLLKAMEQLLFAWEDVISHPTAETARRSLDMAVIAICFETLLVLNGTQSNRRLIQCACKMVSIITDLLLDTRWTPVERALISMGLEPLTCVEYGSSTEAPWDAMLPPGSGSGIKIEHICRLTWHNTDEGGHTTVPRMNFLRLLWQNADIQSSFSDITNTLRKVLQSILGGNTRSLTADEKDGFEPIKTTAVIHQPFGPSEDASLYRFTLNTCIAFLTVGPALQSVSGEPTRDKDLIGLVLDGAEHDPEMFMLVLPLILEKVYQRALNLSVKNLDDILIELSELLQRTVYLKSERLRLLVVQVLESTLDVWTSMEGIVGEDILSNIQDLIVWLARALQNCKIRAWPVRDALARFLSKYLDRDPTQMTWSKEKAKEGTKDETKDTCAQLPLLGCDEDIRVRFRVAALNARLFANARCVHRDPLDVYESIRKSYTVNIDDYENMLTRMLSLGNIMIMSSAVRRGPYWHLLETCIHSPHYTAHIEAILNGVSQRLGMDSLSELFESYASQFAFSIRQAQSDILRFPPHLLGYRDRMSCAEATFRSFTPTNVWNSGRKLFESHCRVLSKPVGDGIRECFGDIIGYQTVTWIHQDGSKLDALEPLLRATTLPDEGFQECFMHNVDGIVASILRTLGDQDFSENGPIIKALGGIDKTGEITRAFQGLTRYRRIEAFELHCPNLPAFPTGTILLALDWLRSQVSDVDAKATTYHVLHQLFAEVERSPLVNEQNRLLNAISLWIALHHQDFDELTLLHTLFHGATTLLSHGDLARTSQSILDWSLSLYRRTKTKHPRIPDLLIRICCLANDYAASNLGKTVTTMGNELLQWIDAQALKLSKVPALLEQVKRALPAWPHQPSTQLSQLYESITSESLSSVINDPRITSSKFRIVRRLRDHALANQYEGRNFATSDFWRLKECIPPLQNLQDADVDAFADLLYLGQGRLDSFRRDSPNSASIFARYKKPPRDSRDVSEMAREPIILTLLAELQGDSASRSYAAYKTLRLIESVSTESLTKVHVWSSEHLTELQYLETCPRSPRPRSERDLGELLAEEEYMDSTKEFPRWIAHITTLFSEVLSGNDAFYAQLTPILDSDTGFAEEVLPVLVHTLLRVAAVSDAVPHRTLLSTYFTNILSSGVASTPCIRSILDIVLHLRNFSVRETVSSSHRMWQDPLSYNKWLDLDFMLLAQNAIVCGAYTTALLFLELAVDNPTMNSSERTSSEQILYEIYRHIDEPDGFYGIHDDDLHQNLMRRFHHEKQWDRAFRFHGAALEAGHSQVGHAEGLIQSFHSFGFDHLANDALRNASFHAENKELSSTSYRLAWRTETWDLPDCDDRSTAASLYLALRAIHRERDGQAVGDIIRSGLNNCMHRLRSLGSESFTGIREVIQDLMCLREIAQWRHGPIRNDLDVKQISINSWESFMDIDPRFNFSDLENIMATRISLVRSIRTKEERQQIGTLIAPFTQALIDIEKKCFIRLSCAARAADQVQIALNSVVRAQRLEKASSFAVFEEFASVLWSQGEEKSAVEYLDRLRCDGGYKYVQDTIADTQRALLLARLGAWSSQACLKKPTDIQRDYFNAAIDILQNATEAQASHAAVHHECAIFAERQYYAIVRSPDAMRWKIYVDRKQQEIQARSQDLLRTQCGSKDYRALETKQKRAQKLLEEDSEMYRTHIVARDTFLKQAINMYSRCLSASDAFDGDAGIRLCSLWFANFENDETGLQDEVRDALDRIPSHKLVFLAHQLSARLSKPASGQISKSQDNLQNLVLRMCHEHPFHSLYQVYCLQPDRSSASSGRRQSERISSPTHTERSAAAGDIFDRLRSDAKSGSRVRDLEHLCDACMEWAKYPIKDDPAYKTKRDHYQFKLPEQVAISKISHLGVPVLTHRTPLDLTLAYDNCIWIDRYESTFTTAGGINLPKINSCVGSDGLKYKQLFKGEGDDDLRQDAVMEQVFELVNDVLSRDRETRRRLLGVRDYKVIPLGSQAGLLEFVGNTCPLTKWLVPAHARYHPKDMTYQEVGPAIIKLQREHGADLDKLVQAFDELKTRFRPVMRHYFTEKHKTPIAWFAMRLNYTRSVATTSIVGHILGLGDRHIANILLDTMSGQVIHIDLGIAFDQGKLLPIPELVPFRMTRDIVDGMGMSGTSGVFHRCAEETLRVLREDSEVIMTVLEVFKHDPLHSWTASEVKIKRVQQVASNATSTSRFGTGIGIDMSSGTAEEAADRALSAVARKLDKALSVQYTVNQLIRDATDSRNLARIFKGWSALC